MPGSWYATAVPNRQEVAVAICLVEGIDKSSDEMPSSSSVPGIGTIACRVAVKAARLTGHYSLHIMVPMLSDRAITCGGINQGVDRSAVVLVDTMNMAL